MLRQAEERVLQFLHQQNRPYNAQGVTDHLAQYGVKKAQAQRALDTLAEASKIVCKVTTRSCLWIRLSMGGAGRPTMNKRPKTMTTTCLQEFGKTKIYMKVQDENDDLSKEVRCM